MPIDVDEQRHPENMFFEKIIDIQQMCQITFNIFSSKKSEIHTSARPFSDDGKL
jgi:hypothetical protein